MSSKKASKCKIITLKFKDPADEIMWLDFETRMRKVVKDLVTPIVDRAQEDWSLIATLEKKKLQSDERINLIENAVFKNRQSTSLFDEFEQRVR